MIGAFIIEYRDREAIAFWFNLSDILPFSIHCSQKLGVLVNIENTLKEITKNLTKKIGISAIKAERTDSPTSVKMESSGDFLSPESPPMHTQEIKSELKPINIPTERHDSGQYRYDSPSSSRRFHSDRTERDFRYSGSDYRNDDYKRSYDRHRRSRSRSRSYERKR